MVSVLSLSLSLSLHFCPPIVALYLDTSPSCFSQMQGERAKAVRSEAKETNKNEVVFESFPSKREIKQIKKELKKQRKEFMEKGTDPVSNPDGFDELDQFFQRLSKSENRKQDQKIAQEMGIPYGSEKVSIHLFCP